MHEAYFPVRRMMETSVGRHSESALLMAAKKSTEGLWSSGRGSGPGQVGQKIPKQGQGTVGLSKEL